MKRRSFTRTAGLLVASAGLGGCVTSSDEPDAREKLVRDIPFDADDEIGSPRTDRTITSGRIDLHGVIFQRAGDKGVVVAGDVINESDQTFEDFHVEVTLYDQNEVEDDLLDSTTGRTENDAFPSGEEWQWAVTFEEQPLPNIDYYTVTAVGYFD